MARSFEGGLTGAHICLQRFQSRLSGNWDTKTFSLDDEAPEDGGPAQTQEAFQRRGSVPTGPKDRSRSAVTDCKAPFPHCTWLGTARSCSASLSHLLPATIRSAQRCTEHAFRHSVAACVAQEPGTARCLLQRQS